MNFKIFNPGVILLILWILGTYSFWRAWLQSTIYPWIKPGHFPGIRKAWKNEFPDDIDSGPYSKEDIGEGTIIYTPKVAFGSRGRKKEVRWRSMAYKFQLDDWWVNFSQGLAGNARVCGWTAVQAGEYEGPLAAARRSQMQKDTNKFWYKSCVNEAFYVNTRTLANLLDSIFFKGVLPLNFQVFLFAIHRQMRQEEGLFIHVNFLNNGFEVLFCILLSFASLLLSEALLFFTTVQGSHRLLLEVQENVESTREHLQKKQVAEAERFATEGPTVREKDGLKMVKDYDHAWKLLKWIVVSGAICTLLFASAVVMMIIALLY